MLKRSRDSEANAERNEITCTIQRPRVSVHNMSIMFSIRISTSFCKLLLLGIILVAPETPWLAKVAMAAAMQLQLTIVEHANPIRAYLRLVRLQS